MFEHLAQMASRIVVTGPHRSGTTIAAQMIARDTGYRYVDEADDVAGFYPDHLDLWLKQKLDSPGVVVQGPSLLKMLVDSPPSDTLVVLMRRSSADVLVSEQSTGWEYRQRELEIFGHAEGDTTAIKYAYWAANPPSCSTEIEYESLSDHWAWVDESARDGWHRKQTAVGTMAISGLKQPGWLDEHLRYEEGATAPSSNVPYDLPTLSTDDIRIYDDVLPPDVFAKLRRYVNDLPFHSVHATALRKVWRLDDGAPLVGSPGGPRADPDVELSAMTDEPSFAHLCDEVERRIRGAGLIEDFQGFTASPWVYPSGSGLSPHVDGQHIYAGSYAYYLHADWRVQQGGLLIVFDPATRSKGGDEPRRPWIDGDEVESVRLNDPGHGVVILPKPNRLVLLSGRAEHMITTVTRGPRVSITGFFNRPGTSETHVKGIQQERAAAIEIMRRLHVSEPEHEAED